MKRPCLTALIISGLWMPGVIAAPTECLSVSANTWSKKGSEFGITYVHWEAELSNECAVSYDADLVIQFVDVSGKVIYQSLDLVSVPRRASAVTDREFNIPDHEFERISDVVVTIKEERERPF